MTDAFSPTRSSETIDVRPHPRLLAVLGDIEFAAWQCLAELIDNSFDDFLAAPATGQASVVAITLPSRGSQRRDAQVWITDNGRGMTLEHLTGALAAGWTSNARYGTLGLFGMGFNIATARLGNVTTVRTTQEGDSEWISVTLNLPDMASSGDFILPVVREPKDDPGEHGTQIIVSDLKPEQHEALSRQQSSIRRILGDVYSYLLREGGISLLVDAIGVEPLLPCVWDKARGTVVGRERYPAYVEIDHELTPLAACQSCGRWQDIGEKRCEECGSDRLETRDRKISGWLGIQRYSHKTDYGIDFIRNGRKILVRDVRMFAWEDPDVPGARPEIEYPIEVPNEGRIVGEIHVDHVRVNYQKNAFEYDTPEWKKVVRLLRGEGPLRPKIAAERGYSSPNESPVGRLFTGYRRLDPGLKSLVPGNGTSSINEKSREWGKLFRKGDPDFLTDERWYEAAKQHDEPRVDVPEEATASNSPAEADARERLGIPDASAPHADKSLSPVTRETEEQKLQRYRETGEVLLDISGSYALPDFGSALNISAYALSGVDVADSTGESVPVYVRQLRGSDVDVFISADHPLFTEFGADTRDLAVIEIAEYIRVRRGSGRSLSSMVAELKDRCLPDQRVTPAALAAIATELLNEVRLAIEPIVSGNSEGFWSLVSLDDQVVTERRFAIDGLETDWSDTKSSGEWIRNLPSSGLARIVQQRPGEFLDGKVFRSGYSGFVDAHARNLTVNRIVGYLNDAGLLAEHQSRRRPDELARGRLSCRLLRSELATDLVVGS